MRVYKRRRAEALTNYKRRLALVKGGSDRLVVRKTNRGIIVQIVHYEEDGDRIVKTVRSSELSRYGWSPRCNIPTAYLSGMLIGKRFEDRNSELVLDVGLYKPIKNSIVFAAAKGFIDSGMRLKNGIEFDSGRMSGSHIADFAAKAAEERERYKGQFSKYEGSGVAVGRITERFSEVKGKIMEGKISEE
jgi:large subunit ribosomal protein L18